MVDPAQAYIEYSWESWLTSSSWFLLFSCGHATPLEALFVHLLIRSSIRRSVMIESKSVKTRISGAAVMNVCVCEWAWDGGGYGWGLHATAHPFPTILGPRVTCLHNLHVHPKIQGLTIKTKLRSNTVVATTQFTFHDMSKFLTSGWMTCKLFFKQKEIILCRDFFVFAAIWQNTRFSAVLSRPPLSI